MPQKKRVSFVRNIVLSFLTLVILTSGFVGCDLTGGFSTTITSSTQAAVNVLNNAIAALNNQSADWQMVLQNAQDQLTESAQSTIRNEISNTLIRAEQAAATEICCIVDFLRVRVQEALEGILAKLQGKPVNAPVPVLCQISPPVIDLSLDPTRRSYLILDGYNFDTAPAVQAFLFDGTGYIDESNSLTVQTQYQMTLNLGTNGINITSTSQKVILMWKGTQLSSIPVIQSTPQCMKSIVYFTPGPVTFIPTRLQGNNRDFDDYGVSVELMVLPTTISGSSLGVEVYMRATTGTYGHPPTTVDGFQSYTLYSAEPGKTIVSVGGDASNVDYSYIHSAGGQMDYIQISAGWVSEAIFSGFWPPGSPSAGETAQVMVSFKNLPIQLEKTQGCV